MMDDYKPSKSSPNMGMLQKKKKAVAEKMAAKKKPSEYMNLKKWNQFYGPDGYLTKDLKTMGLKAPKKPSK